jgi:endonuclease YncB( thermonuclease family)
MVGLLRVRGSIELDQFWPKGSADADTAKILVTVGPDSFKFAADGETFKRTEAFFGASSRGKTSKPVIDNKSRITARLQGIDAPELHYRASPIPRKTKISANKRAAFNAANKERRQHWAESATVALAKKLSNFGQGQIKCEFVSFVDHPYEVIDTYGRFVGNIRVGKDYRTDINIWLTAEGWVYPAFYSSMSVDEITDLLEAMKKGRKEKRVWPSYSKAAGKFEEKLLYRKGGPVVDVQKDRGTVLLPKLYRRQVTYRMQKKAKIITGSFLAFLQNSLYECHFTRDFLKKGPHASPTRHLHEFLKGNAFMLEPHELVFKEDDSSLVDAKGKVVDEF